MRVDKRYTLNPGMLRERVTIQTPVYSKSASGADVATWVDFVTLNADVRQSKRGAGLESLSADRFAAKVQWDVTIRWYDGITESMRVLWGTRALNILRVPDTGLRVPGMLLECEEQR